MKKAVGCLFFMIFVLVFDFVILLEFYSFEEDYIPIINYHRSTTSPTSTTKKVQIDDNVYDKLTIESLFVSNEDSNDIDKISWYYKSSDSTYYLFLPKNINRDRMRLEFSTGTITYLSIYDNDNNLVKKITSGDIISLGDSDYIFKLDTNVKKESSYKVKILQSDIGALYLNLDGGDNSYRAIVNDGRHKTSYPGDAVITGVDNTVIEASFSKFKGRGNATWRRDKKPFSLKFDEKISILGMPEAKSWTLLANHFDGSMARNYLWLHFAQDMGLDYSVDAKPAEVYVNNKYIGTYTITSKVEVKSNRVDIADNEFLFEFDHHIGKGQFKLNHGYPVIIHNPDLDTLTASERQDVISRARSYLNKIESLIYNAKTSIEDLEKYIDLESFAKYYWVNEISLNFDAARNSVYCYVKDGKLYAGPTWDMDATMNRSYTYTKNLGYYVTDDSSLNTSRTSENWFRPLLKRTDFSRLVDEVFLEYYDVISDLPNKLEAIDDELSASAVMNYTRWPYAKMIANQWDKTWISGNKDYRSAMDMFSRDLVERVNWYKNQYANLNYEEVKYKAMSDDKELMDAKIQTDRSIILPKNTKSVLIYGIKDGKEIKLKELQLNDYYVNDIVEIKNRTTSNYKKYNQVVYNVSFLLLK